MRIPYHPRRWTVSSVRVMDANCHYTEHARMKPGAPNVLLVFPRFNPHSFWSLRGVLDVVGVRCPTPPLGLITLAALLPQTWNFKLIDRNAEELTGGDLDWADIVMTGGMLRSSPTRSTSSSCVVPAVFRSRSAAQT